MTYRSFRRRACLLIGVALIATSAQAQSPLFSSRATGQVINAALQAVLPPSLPLTGRTVAERGIRFDFERTLAAFGLVDNAQARASLHLNRAVTEGTASLLADCDQVGTKSCTQLGASAYVYVEPISVSDSEARVWVHVVWASTPSERTYMSGSSKEVFLSRAGRGPWTFVRTGRGVIS